MTNRVKDYYETAVKFLALDPMAQYIIGTSFHLMQYEEYILNYDELSDIIFQRVIEKNMYEEFRTQVMNYKKFTGSARGSYQ